MAYVTIKDVARQAGVSVPAVSQTLNNTGRLTEATRQKVRAAMRQLNYIPNSAAQSMRSCSTKTIGLLVPDIRNPYFACLSSAVIDQLAQSGYTCLIGSSSESISGQDTFLRTLLSQRIDGAIIVPQGRPSAGLYEFLNAGFPVVFLDRGVGQQVERARTVEFKRAARKDSDQDEGPADGQLRAEAAQDSWDHDRQNDKPLHDQGNHPEHTDTSGQTGEASQAGQSTLRLCADIPLIDSDPFPGTRHALLTARSLGHQRIGFVHGPVAESPNLQERQDVFERIGASLLGSQNTLIARSSEPLIAIEELLAAQVRTFIFGYSPDALAGLRYFRERGLAIGTDVSVISFDDIPFFELTTPAISVISQQLEIIGVEGAKTLLGLLGRQEVSVGATTPEPAGEQMRPDSPTGQFPGSGKGSAAETGTAPMTRLRVPTQFISRASVLDRRA